MFEKERVKRKILIAVSVAAAIILAAGLASFGLVRIRFARSLPALAGTLELQGLSGQVDVYRDEYGIPHIYAQDKRDLLFAVGFVSAQDRLWQMDLARRAAEGKLAEIVGEQILRTDLLMRTLGLERTAQRQFDLLSPENAALLTAYADGVNVYINGLETLPPEFQLLKYRPEPWRPADSLAISRLLGWRLSKNYESELVMMRVAARVGPERARDLSPSYPAGGPFILSKDTAEEMASTLLDPGDRLEEIIGLPGGSNSWVLAPSRTESGAALLANDPHLSGTWMPSIWYYVHLIGDGFDVIGALVPGMPLPLLGHNRNIGWGITNMNADVQDVYIEQFNPHDPNQYEYDGAWVDMDTFLERIPFRTENGEISYIQKEVRRTIHGPVINDAVPKALKVISLSWTGLEPTPDFEALLGINLAKNWDDFCRALEKFGVAPQNFIYADTSGSGIFPQEGWTSSTTWSDWLPFEEMPHAFNPPVGYIVTANNQVTGDDYQHFLSAEWAPSFRSLRIRELIEERERHDAKSMARIQSDTKSLLAESICECIGPALLEGLPDIKYNQAALLLSEWDYNNTMESPAALLYHQFLITFARNTFADELGDTLAKDYLSQYYLWMERFVELVKEDSVWFDNVRTDAFETRDDIIRQSFKEAVDVLENRWGEDMSKWRWGDAHQVQFHHPLDKSGVAKFLFDIGPFPFPGDGETINRGTFDFNEPYAVTMAASIRHIMDFSQLNRTLGIHTTGQSGHLYSKHYSDFAGKWLAGEYITLMMAKEDFTGSMEGCLQLLPASRQPQREQ
jgi:penicillin amidase